MTITINEEYNIGKGSQPTKYFPLDFKGKKSFEHVEKSFIKLFKGCGGINNLVFYPPECVEYEYTSDGVETVYYLYNATTDITQSESVFKVIDLSLVDERYLSMVEVE